MYACTYMHLCVPLHMYIMYILYTYVHLQVLGRQQKLQPATLCIYNTHTHTLAIIYISIYAYTCVCVCIHIGWL